MRCTKIDFFVTHGNPTGPTPCDMLRHFANVLSARHSVAKQIKNAMWMD